MKAFFSKAGPMTLYASSPEAEDFLRKLKPGAVVSVEVKSVRNIKFHRKFFSLLNLAYDMWEPIGAKQHRGQDVLRNFENFRSDILILAGHYDTVFGVDGSFKLVAKSISFSNCDEAEFERIYKSVLDVCWDRIFNGRKFNNTEEVERAAAQFFAYSG